MADAPPTFSESWYRIASQRIWLQPWVRVRRQMFRGERWIVLENPFTNQYFRLRPAAYEFVARLHPERTVEEVWKECLNKFPDEAPGQEAVIQLLAQLYQGNLLQYNVAADAAQLFKRYQRTRQREIRARLLNIMFMRIPLLDPDAFLVRTLPVIGKLISPIGAIIWLAVVVGAVHTALSNFDALKLQTEAVLAPSNLFLLYIGLVLIKTLHEFGHAYFCRHFGGEVHVMGIMFMIFTPVPYMDATSSWGFRSRWKRILVGAGGMIVELFVAGLATFVWANTGQGTIHSLAYNMMFVASVSTLVFNLNPLLRFDGYYILSDLLEIPNLTQRANGQLRYWWERYVFGLKKLDNPTHSKREASWLTVFGITSGIYRVIVFAGILLLVADRFLLIGIIMAAVCLVAWIAVPLTKLVIYLASSPKLERHRLRAVTVTVVLVGGLLSVLQFLPFPNHFRAPGVLRSREWTQVHNEAPGNLLRIVAQPGMTVKAGDVLLELANPELELDFAAAKAALAEVEARLLQAMNEATANLKPLQSRLESTRKRIQRLEMDRAALTVRARQNGVWVAPQVKDYVGRWLPRGSELGLLIEPASFQFLATVAQEDGDSLFARARDKAEVRLFGQSGEVIPVNQFKIIPAEKQTLPSPALGWAGGGEVPVSPNDPQGQRAAEPFFEVRAEVQPDPEAALLHGRAGKIRFELPSEPLLPRWLRRFRQLLQKRYEL
jgi:putative peptide zinc metalloprotease protein